MTRGTSLARCVAEFPRLLPAVLPRSALTSWLQPDTIRASFRTVLAEQVERCLERLVQIGPHAVAATHGKNARALVAAYRLESDNLKWVLSKIAPETFGARPVLSLPRTVEVVIRREVLLQVPKRHTARGGYPGGVGAEADHVPEVHTLPTKEGSKPYG